MNQSTIQRILLVAGITVLAVGMLAGFAGPVAAQEEVENSVDAEVDQDQTNTQVTSQSQTGVADASAAQDISVDVSANASQDISVDVN